MDPRMPALPKLKLPLLFVLLAAALLVGCGPTGAGAPEKTRAELRGDSARIAEFRAAERETGVPAELLATVAYVQTRLSMNLGVDAHADDHAHAPREHGLMAIGGGGLTSLEAAALLAGMTEQRVATEPGANIRAAALLLRTLGHARGVGQGDGLDAWIAVVEGYGGEALVVEVRRRLVEGFRGVDDEGKSVEVDGLGWDTDDDGLGVIQQGLGYPGAIWSAAYSGNYTNASRGAAQINYVIIHTTQGSYAGAISWFKNSSSNVSAHYVIRSSDGEITQMVDDADIAWHDGCFNSETIGIEHEGYVADPGKWYTDAMYKSSAKLTAWLCDQYGIPKDKAHVMGHGEAPDCSDHTDPGSGWDWSYYMDLVNNGGCAPKTEVCNGKDDDCDGKTDEGDVCNQKPKGYLDSVSCDGVRGWTQDPDAPTQSIDVHLYFGGPAGSSAPGAGFSANQSRQDLCAAIGSCEHGFDVAPPLSLFDGQAHPIHAYGIDSAGGENAELSGSPISLECAASVPTGVRRHVTSMDSFDAWKLDLFWDLLPLTDAQIGSLEQAEAWPSAPKLVQADDGSLEVWLVDAEWRRHVPDPAAMAAWGFSFGDVQTMAAADVDALWEGPKLRPRPVVVKDAAGKIDMIDDPLPKPSSTALPSPEQSGWGGEGGSVAGNGKPGKSGPTTGGPSSPESSDGACACRQSSDRRAGPWSLLLLAALPWVRRRGRAKSKIGAQSIR